MNYLTKLKIYLIITSLLLVAGCNSIDLGKAEKTPRSLENSPTPSENVVTANSDPAETVRKAIEILSAARSFRSQREIINSPMPPLKTIEEFVAPDRYHGVQTNTGNETINIGNNTYNKVGNSNWAKSDLFKTEGDRQVMKIEAIKEYLKQLPKDNKEYKAVGSETIDGVPVMVYQFSYSTAAPTGKPLVTTMKMWIGTRDNLPYKIESEQIGEFLGEPFEMKMITKYFDFGADIKIEAPL